MKNLNFWYVIFIMYIISLSIMMAGAYALFELFRVV